MKFNHSSAKIAPWRLYLTILAIVYASEFCVMLLLPFLTAPVNPPWLVGILDASMLTLMLVPLLGWLIIRPLQNVVEMRAMMLQQFITMQEDERGRIARDLHDEIGQSFSSVLMGLRTFDQSAQEELRRQRMAELAEVVTRTLEEVRRVARGLRPAVLDHLGLVRAMEQYLDDFRSTHGIEVKLQTEGLEPDCRLPSEIETAVYRIAQESLTNTARHSGASQAQVSMRLQAGGLQVEVTDNGRGITRRQLETTSGVGAIGMAERAALLGGWLDIESVAGDGTRVSLWIPLPQRRAA